MAAIYSLSMQLAAELKKRKKKLVLAESCTGGGLAAELTMVMGSSVWFDRAYVVYSNQAKVEMLGVAQDTLEVYGAVSEQTAKEMAEGALNYSHGDMSLSITGIAGPGGSTSNKPVGTVWFARAERDVFCEARCVHFTGGRHQIRLCSARFALRYLLETLQ